MKRPIAVVLLLLAAGTGAFLYFRNRNGSPEGVLPVSGNIEATEVEMSFRIGGRVAERAVSEGDVVKAGQVVARLDSRDLEADVALRKAQVRAVEAALAELSAGSRPEEIGQAEAAERRAQAALDALLAGSRTQELQAAEAALARERAEAERLRTDAARQAELYRLGLISARENDAAQAAYHVALARVRESDERRKLVVEGPRQEEIRQARAALEESTQRLRLVRKGPRTEAIEQARARVAEAREALAQAETRLGYATVTAPLSGVVLSKNVEPGEYVAPGTPVVTVADLARVWLRAYVDETDLGRVKLGQRVRVTSDTFPGKAYEGRLSFLSSEAEFTPKSVQTRKERVKLVYRIKVDVENPASELKPGMPADAAIELGHNDHRTP
ncbi:MAG: efflux RND transporter periplasmic adaptor subunit [Deltaproteobacteria bacterium]|nr:efflux RND transporter periplasmic adaptor subunit [Deltaproteobacteria bacterium]